MDIVLWDMDDTLLRAFDRSGVSRFEVAMMEITGKTLPEVKLTFKKDGLTDRIILRRLMEIHGIEPYRLHECMQILDRVFEERMSNYDIKILPGAVDLLVALSMKGITLGLVTGGLPRTVNLKLKKVGLLNFFSRRADSGNEHTERYELLNIAIGLSRRENVVYIGDTPNDVISGKKAGVKTIIVGTGPWDKESIMKEEPDLFVENFVKGKIEVLKFITGTC